MKEDISHILECAGLIHDIGNPPFGHFGEIAIREWFERNLPKLTFCQKNVSEMFTAQMKQDFFHFEGNALALRLVTRLHYLVDEHGMNLTYALQIRISDKSFHKRIFNIRRLIGKSEAEKLYLRLLLVTDYVCGMTDSYAKRLYQEMNGII